MITYLGVRSKCRQPIVTCPASSDRGRRWLRLSFAHETADFLRALFYTITLTRSYHTLTKKHGRSDSPITESIASGDGTNVTATENGTQVATSARAERAPDPSQRRMRDFTTGSIWQHIIAFSWPMFVGNALQALYNAVDSFWVGRFIGPQALGAVSVSFPIIFALVALINGLTMATTTLVAQYRGAREEEQVRRTVANSLVLIAILGVISTVIGLRFSEGMLRLIQTPAEIMEPAAAYLSISFLGIVPSFVYFVMSSVLRGLGDSQTPLRFLVYATFINIVLDPIFIIGLGPIPAMGVRGAAWATLIAQTVSAILALRYIARYTNLLSRKLDEWRLVGHLVAKLVTVGIPAALQSVVVSFSMVVVSALVNSFGANVVAAFGAASRLDQFAFLPAMSISVAVGALVGQNLGAGKHERVQEIVRFSSILTVAITGLMTVVALTTPTILIRFFTDEAAVLAEGAVYLRIVGLNYIPLALMFTITGVMRGAGDTVPSMMISFVTLWIVRLPLGWLLSTYFGWGVQGVWWSIVISTTLGLVLNYWYYRTGNWKRRVVTRMRPSPA